jgi:AbrB family looped-hinge helix DNA binding protein
MSKDDVKCKVRCSPPTCCKLDALVTIDERGQIVLPKEIREKAEIKAGDKLAVISCEKDGKISCITIVKADEFREAIKKAFGPLLEELLR